MAIEITDTNFDEVVLKATVPVMVDLWAIWCSPCRTIAPIVIDLASEYKGRAIVGKLDVDSNQVIPAQYGVSSIPTLLFFKNGQLMDRVVGATPKSVLEEKLKKLL